MAAIVATLAGSCALTTAFVQPTHLAKALDAATRQNLAGSTGTFSGSSGRMGQAGCCARAFPAIVLGFVFSALARRRTKSSRPGSGRVIVRGRNYETNIKKKKGPAEQRKAQLAKKHLGFISLAVKEGGPDEDTNRRLKSAIRAALKDNVPRATVDNRIKKMVEGKESVYELSIGGYGLGGTAVMVSCVTDNTSRCRVDIKEAFKEAGGHVGNDGCVDHTFNKQGIIRFEDVDEETVMEASMEAEVEDVVATEGDVPMVEVTTLPENLHSAQVAFEEAGLEPRSCEVEFKAVVTNELSEQNTYETKRLVYLLEELDEVQAVRHNGILKEGVELMFSNYGIPFSYERSLKG